MRLELWIKGQEASLEEILDGRERRGEIQRELLTREGASLVSFTLNIPGPVKVFPFAIWLFETGDRLIRQMVKEEQGEILQSREKRENMGLEGFYLLDLAPEKVKRNLSIAEETIPWEDYLILTYWIDGEEKFPDRSWDFRKESVSSAAALLFCAAVPGSTVQKKFSTGRSG